MPYVQGYGYGQHALGAYQPYLAQQQQVYVPGHYPQGWAPPVGYGLPLQGQPPLHGAVPQHAQLHPGAPGFYHPGVYGLPPQGQPPLPGAVPQHDQPPPGAPGLYHPGVYGLPLQGQPPLPGAVPQHAQPPPGAPGFYHPGVYDPSATELGTEKHRNADVKAIILLVRIKCRSATGGYQWRCHNFLFFVAQGMAVRDTPGKWLMARVDFMKVHPTLSPSVFYIIQAAHVAQVGHLFIPRNVMEAELFCEMCAISMEVIPATQDVKGEVVPFDEKVTRLTLPMSEILNLKKPSHIKEVSGLDVYENGGH